MALTSKPSLLSASIQSIEEHTTSLVRHDSISKACSCWTSRETSQYYSNWRYFSVSYGTSDTRRHLPDCKFSHFGSGTRSSNFTIASGRLKHLFQTAVALSFVYTRGAGGQSISSALSCHPIVDIQKAPAFRIANLVSGMIANHAADAKMNEVAKAAQCCYNSILVLYSRGKFSPREIASINGWSIMHAVAETASEIVSVYLLKF